jgi:hypothetical protein
LHNKAKDTKRWLHKTVLRDISLQLPLQLFVNDKAFEKAFLEQHHGLRCDNNEDENIIWAEYNSTKLTTNIRLREYIYIFAQVFYSQNKYTKPGA